MAGEKTWTYDQASEDELFKAAYGKFHEISFNQDSPLYSRIKKNTRFKGKSMTEAIRFSYGGGRGSGTLPGTSRPLYEQVKLETKKLYCRVSVDNETFETSKSPLGAFVNMAKEPLEVARIGMTNLLERQIVLGDLAGSGLIGVTDGGRRGPTGTPNAGAQFAVDLDMTVDAGAALLEPGDILDLYSPADPPVRLGSAFIRVIRPSGILALTVYGDDYDGTSTSSGDKLSVYMQGSKDKELSGLRGVLNATVAATSGGSSLYKGIRTHRDQRWDPYQKTIAADAQGANLNIKKELNEVVLDIYDKCGKSPTVVMCNTTVYRLILDAFEDTKQILVGGRDKGMKSVKHGAFLIAGPKGPIPIIHNRYVPEEELYVLNEDKIELHCRHKPKWFDRDGTVFLREKDDDAYEARYGVFCDLLIHPFYQGIVKGVK